ncbi:hypothetical protein FUAX_03190 [Fulvitalea axinellae]|uniref:Uncharacterized protein n=1 Tax=Fulvitalea axinellae TaxID=1182444 RepID=A0AAU9CJ48_9BACT|nr:hypothetical protein FUAX_03190 [Fulvitalea axinellae]
MWELEWDCPDDLNETQDRKKRELIDKKGFRFFMGKPKKKGYKVKEDLSI